MTIPSFRHRIKRFFAPLRRQKRTIVAAYIVLGLITVAIFADFLANDRPLAVKQNGTWQFPMLQTTANATDWKTLNADFILFAPIAYAPSALDKKAHYQKPTFHGKHPHLLGTDEQGRDVAAAMIHGTRTAITVGVVAMGIAFFIGVTLGAVAGYFGNGRVKISVLRLVLNILALPLAVFYGFGTRQYALSDALARSAWQFFGQLALSLALFGGVFFVFNGLVFLIQKTNKNRRRKMILPLDTLFNLSVQTVVAVPILVLVLAVIAIVPPSIYSVMLVIGLVSWTGIARFVRAEMLKIRRTEYIEAATALGFSQSYILLRHALPNALSPVFISLAFGMAGAILAESFLSFLGIGLPPDVVTWGKLLAISRQNYSAWWLAVFPGVAIFVTVMAFNLLGEGLNEAFNPKMKNEKLKIKNEKLKVKNEELT